MPKPLTVWITTNCGKFFKRWDYLATLPVSWKIWMQVKKKQLEPDMEQLTGYKLGREYVRAVFCHSAYLIYMTRWTWVWVNSGSWWWTGRPGVLRFLGSQRVEHDWATELKGTVDPCPVLTVTSWPAYCFLKSPVRWSGIPISLRIFHSLLWSTQLKALA